MVLVLANRPIPCQGGVCYFWSVVSGISPDLKSVDDVLGIMRPTGIPDQGLLCDLVWADPEKGLKGYKINDARGISVMYGANEVRNFLATNNLDLICRAHQVCNQEMV